MRPTILSFIIMLLMFTACKQEERQQIQHDHGVVHFETSCTNEAHYHFIHGLGMLHHMMYEQSEEIFNKALDADPECAIAYWGVAMTKLHPIWAPPSDQQFKEGHEAIQKAAEVGNPTQKEQDYIEAMQAYYARAKEENHKAGLKAWENAHEQLYDKYPDDIDAGAFYGLSLLATAPPEDETFSQQRKAGAMMEELHEKAPEHPGLFHYIIHAYDNPVLAEKGIEYAHQYDKLAPDVPHALHMPSHIFVRVGKWEEAIDWNLRSAEAARNQPVNGMTSLHHAHAMDYLIYAYLQQGRDEKAKQIVDELLAVEQYQPSFASAYGIAAGQARYFLEQGKWEEAANLNLDAHANFPWENFPQYEAIIWWARGLGAARIKDFSKAKDALDKIKQLHQATLENNEDYWALLVDAQAKSIEAWMLHEQGKHQEAQEMMRKAAEQEDSVDKHPVTPSEVLPARELLGDMLLLHKKPDEALTAYEAALEISPNRFNSLFGAARAAELAGKEEIAKDYYATLYRISVPAESERKELLMAVNYIAGK